jgi:hypothetical protein
MNPPTFGLLAGFLAVTCVSTLGIESNFDTGPEDWQVADLRTGGPYVTPLGYFAATWLNSGGESGGCLSVHDPSNNSFAFDAPTNFLGNWSGFLGARLAFSLRSTHQNWTEDSVVIVVGTINGNPRAIVSPITPQPGTNWTSYWIELSASQFRYDTKTGAGVTAADFQQVITNVTALRINGEFGAAVQETVGLDSVSLPARPRLQIHRAAGDVVLSWPEWASAFQLQRNGELGAVGWLDVTNAPMASGDRLFVTNSVVSQPTWYRLRWP